MGGMTAIRTLAVPALKRLFGRLVPAVLLTVAVAAAVGCGPAGKQTEEKDKLVFAIRLEPTTLDPQYQLDRYAMLLCDNIYDTLVFREADGSVSPRLSDSWEVSDDGTEYLFHLKEGVRFHDGSGLTAEDVKYTIDRSLQSPYCMSFNFAFEGAEVVDEHTVKVLLKYPFSPTLNILATSNFAVVSKAAVEKAGDAFGHNPVGTGPYRLKEWKDGQKLVLERNDDYYSGPAAVRLVEIPVIKEQNTVMVALNTGEIDGAENLDATSRAGILDNRELVLYETEAPTFWHLGFNCQAEPFDNKLVRQAVSHAVKKEDVIAAAKDGLAVPADTALQKSVFGYSEDVKAPEYDPVLAKKLLAKAGYENGFSCSLLVREDFTYKIGQVIQSQLKEVGIDVELIVYERSAFMEQLMKGNHQMCILGSGDSALDAAFSLAFINEDNIGAGGNFYFYANPEVNRLLKQAEREMDGDRRKELYKEILLLEKEEAPRVPLYFDYTNIVCRKELAGVTAGSSVLFYQYSWNGEK